MALGDSLRELQERALSELAAAHDYYIDTKMAWRILRNLIKRGLKFTIRNSATKTVTMETELATKTRAYAAEELAEATFLQFITIFENFFFDFLRLWLLAYPQSLGAREVPFKAILDAPDKDAIALYVIDKELHEIGYKQPRDWFKYLETKVKLGCPTEEEIDRIGEAKASRDILAHNRGIANKIYKAKAGKLARFEEGKKIDIPEPYHRDTWGLIRKVITDVSTAASAKVT